MTSTPSSKSFSSPWQDRWSSTTLPSKKLLSAVLPFAILFAVRSFSSYPFWIISDEQERKLEKTRHIKERIATRSQPKGDWRKLTGTRRIIHQHSRPAEREGRKRVEEILLCPLPFFLYDAIRFFPRKAVFLLRSPYINGAISRIAFPQNLCSAGSASSSLLHAFRQCLIKIFLICSTGFS